MICKLVDQKVLFLEAVLLPLETESLSDILSTLGRKLEMMWREPLYLDVEWAFEFLVPDSSVVEWVVE